MSTHQPYQPIRTTLRIFGMAHQFIRQGVEDIPESRMTEQPGTLVNHPAWTLAHLNAYAGLVLALLDDPSVPNADAELEKFGYGSAPVADPGAYATKAELLARFSERHERIAAIVADKHAEYFPRPSPEKFQPHASCIGDVASILMTTHLGYHLGQLNQWRRAAGIASKK
ncbi:MAG: DinB family protein [Phycisphaerales bacterium]|nr:DinB family protein [Phycisphaerales bacterium]